MEPWSYWSSEYHSQTAQPGRRLETTLAKYSLTSHKAGTSPRGNTQQIRLAGSKYEPKAPRQARAVDSEALSDCSRCLLCPDTRSLRRRIRRSVQPIASASTPTPIIHNCGDALGAFHRARYLLRISAIDHSAERL